MSTLLAPPALLPLAEVLAAAPEGQEPAPGFTGWVAGREYTVTAVLERVAVIEEPGNRWADRHTIRHAFVLVDPSAVTWRPKVEMDQARSVWLATGSPERAEVMQARRAERGLPAKSVVVPAGEARASWRTCSRPTCSTRIHPTNTSGLCAACQRICPACGGPKAQPADVCRSCRWDAGTEPERPDAPADVATPAPPAPPAADVERLTEELAAARRRIAELEAELERRGRPMTIEQVIDRLVIERRQRDLSQREVAERIGATQAAMSSYENGGRRGDAIGWLARWADALGFDLVLELRARPEGGGG